MRALVLDAHLSDAVAGLRALGRAGVDAVAVGPLRAAGGLWSRYASQRVVIPDPVEEPAAFAAELARAVDGAGAAIAYPASEETIDALVAQAGSQPDWLRLPYPNLEGLQALRDKRRLPELAAAAGLRAPRTLAEGTVEELLGMTPPAEPCVVKPTHGHQRRHPRLRSNLQIFAARDFHDELRQHDRDQAVFVQERVSGPLFSLELVVDPDGRVIDRFQQRAHATWPSEGGTITLSVSVPPDESLVERAAALLGSVGHWGMVSMDLVAGSEGPVLLDVNPRFYTCLPLSLACGLNLPASWHGLLSGGDVPDRPAGYPSGVWYRSLEPELVAGLRGHPRRLLRRAPSPRVGAMWAGDDPVPAGLLAAVAARQRYENLLRRARGG